VYPLKELVEYIARSLVDKPEDVEVIETENERAVILEIRVAPEGQGNR